MKRGGVTDQRYAGGGNAEQMWKREQEICLRYDRPIPGTLTGRQGLPLRDDDDVRFLRFLLDRERGLLMRREDAIARLNVRVGDLVEQKAELLEALEQLFEWAAGNLPVRGYGAAHPLNVASDVLAKHKEQA